MNSNPIYSKTVKRNSMSTKNSLFKVLLAMVLLAVMDSAYAWSKVGHEWIVQSAAMELDQNLLDKYDALLKEGIIVPPLYYHAKVGERLGAISAWPDKIRNETLVEVFKQYGSGAVPPALLPWANKTSSEWHFTNQIYVNEKGGALGDKCKLSPSGDLINVWPALLESFKQVKTGRDKNIIVAFALHLAADAYQPLHLMSSVNKQCKPDRGGNNICLIKGKSGKACPQNLHQLWDDGFETFKQPLGWHMKQHPTNIFHLKDAQKLAEKAALSVYSNDGNYQSPQYISSANESSLLGADTAVGHCVFLLKYLFNQ